MTVPDLRVGLGFDLHRFVDDDHSRPLVLGGVVFTGHPGLVGHSDADVVVHACADALLSAGGLGDIGDHFPDTDPRWEGANSLALLAEAAQRLRNERWTPTNIDCAVVLDQPHVASRREEMQRRLSEAVGAPVTIKGRRTEGIGALGRGEGVAAWAVALVCREERT